jgi:hypothetical protein
MITIYNGSGKIYQTILPNENDIIYNDLIKYIHILKHPDFDEIDFNNKIYDIVFVKTTIILFDNSYNEIKLDDDITKNELFIMFNYKYYVNSNELINDIKNYDNIFDAIKSDPYKLIFIDPQIENYDEICTFAVQQNWYAFQYVKNQTEEICQLVVQQNGYALQYIKNQTEEICKLAIQKNGYALKYIKNQTEELCKLAVQQTGYALKYVENQTEEICKLAIQEMSYSLEYVKEQTEEICKLAVEKKDDALHYIKDIVMKEKIFNLLLEKN